MLRQTALEFLCFTPITRVTKNRKSAVIKTFILYVRELYLGRSPSAPDLGDSEQTQSTRHSIKRFGRGDTLPSPSNPWEHQVVELVGRIMNTPLSKSFVTRLHH